MNATPEATPADMLPKFSELVLLVQMPKPERFAELARTYNTDDDTDETSGRRKGRDLYAGKIICAARIMLEQQSGRRQQSFNDYFKNQYGCLPSTHGQTCAKTYRNLVLTGKITESDYDRNSANAIETACKVIAKVKEDLGHPAIAAAASILRKGGTSAAKELKALLERLSEDPATGQVRLLDQAPADATNTESLAYVPALELAYKIAEEGHQSALAAPLEKMAASTPDLDEARSLFAAATKILTGLSNNRDERGQRRYSDEMIAEWKTPEIPRLFVTQETLKADYAVAKKRVQEMENKLFQAGIQPLEPSVSRAVSSHEAVREDPTYKAWRIAEEQVLKLMRSWGWQVEDVSRQNLGYDIEGRTLDGKAVFAEVKNLEKLGQRFSLSSNEEAVARKKSDAYLMALVRLTATHFEVALIRDPVNRLRFTTKYERIFHECAEYEFQAKRYALE